MSETTSRSRTIMVVGGGIAGITAAVEAAEAGHDVVLIEKSPSLGGRVAQMNRYFPKLCHPTCGLEINFQRIKKSKRISVFTFSEVSAVKGGPGGYTVTVKTSPRHVKANCTACGDCAKVATSEVSNAFNYGMDSVKSAYLPHVMAFPMRYVVDPSVVGTPEGEAIKAACPVGAVDLEQKDESFDLEVGAVVWATGWRPYPAANLTAYRWTDIPDVITNVEMERLASVDGPTKGKIVRPSNGEAPKRVALIQCAGSRDLNHLAYCSRICCLASMKHAAYVREQLADATVDVYYIDLRAHDKLESFLNRLKRDPQVNFVKSKPARIEKSEAGGPVVCGENTLTREVYAEPYDLVVLATGMQASLAAEGQPSFAADFDDYGFVFAEGDSIAAGVASGPLDVSMSVQSATAAACRAIRAVTA
ncbi:FAD-dependent oxidoreductase [Magnetospirillum moscoviense]|uniref:Heterodisulfide reductase subunit A n=1 Tax=Magnetospirillum moscoviense TaxID=1437059 RepID=A0A178MID8_9PROT|nr:FAD-dependent oxidoreductase [Magnetospirillum moscoviense]MBF0325216.1 CoB--CoM heterodisulfide reductase iron-sulfur subunit A family protein [Alphaproteobacteria bacterium]OAN47937.1 heterodisulfide reductase subunit A [Magnetospirillum moscoviense]